MRVSHRNGYLFLLFISCLALAFGLYLQYFEGVMPCLLCSLQRFFLLLLILSLFLAVFLVRGKFSKNIINSLSLVIIILGFSSAIRQVWLQHQPASGNLTCLPGFVFLLKNFPLSDVIRITVTGTADCAVVHWRFLGLSLSEWSAIFFAVTFAGVLYQFRKFQA